MRTLHSASRGQQFASDQTNAVSQQVAQLAAGCVAPVVAPVGGPRILSVGRRYPRPRRRSSTCLAVRPERPGLTSTNTWVGSFSYCTPNPTSCCHRPWSQKTSIRWLPITANCCRVISNRRAPGPSAEWPSPDRTWPHPPAGVGEPLVGCGACVDGGGCSRVPAGWQPAKVAPVSSTPSSSDAAILGEISLDRERRRGAWHSDRRPVGLLDGQPQGGPQVAGRALQVADVTRDHPPPGAVQGDLVLGREHRSPLVGAAGGPVPIAGRGRGRPCWLERAHDLLGDLAVPVQQ